jgi:hypothetical protein
MEWRQVGKIDWFEDSIGARIKLCPSPDRYFVYVKGEYLGSNEELAAAQKRAKDMERSPRYLQDELEPGGLPAFVALTEEERRQVWAAQSSKKRRQVLEYKDMDVEQLTRSYNESVEVATSKGLSQFKAIPKFKDKATALKFLEQIDAAIAGVTATAAATPPAKPPTKAETRKEGDKAVKEFKKNGGKITKVEPEPKVKAKAVPKAPAKAATKAATKAPAAPAKAKGGAAGTFLEQIAAREGTNKEKLATLLHKSLGKDLNLGDVTKVVYGKADNPAIAAVINGLSQTIKKNSLPYEIRTKENKVGLHPASK